MKKISKILIANLVGLSLIGASTPIEASSSKNNTANEDIVLFQNVGGRNDDEANFVLIECESNSAMKKELRDIKLGMSAPGTVIYFKNDHDVKNVYFCASNRVVKDGAMNKEELIKSGGNKIKLSKKTAFVKLDQVLWTE